MQEKTKIAVFGLGYVGCVTATCLSELGFNVVGVDVDEFKVSSVLDGRAPFYEPGLDSLIAKNVLAGKLSATTSSEEALWDADIAFICVGTPSEKNGNVCLDVLRSVSAEIGNVLKQGRAKRLTVVVRSTVFPGACEEIVMPQIGPIGTVVANPEFLREGTAVRDFFEPSLIVIGSVDQRAVKQVGQLYAQLDCQPAFVSLRTAEMIKYACNAFHAVKIAFANEIGSLAEWVGVDGTEVMDTLVRDKKLNVSPAYLKPGFAFGGSCLPKDLRAIAFRASRLDVRLPMLQSVLPSNEEHLRRACDEVMASPGKIGVFGLAFKEDTDDLRESATIAMIEYLLGKGREIKVFDPHVKLDNIYGKNKNFLLSALPHVGRLMESDLNAFLEWSDVLVVAQKPSAEITAKLADSECQVINLIRAELPKAAYVSA